MIRGCSFARLIVAPEEEGDLPVVVDAVVTEAIASLCSANGYVLTTDPKLQSESESDPETDAGEEPMIGDDWWWR